MSELRTQLQRDVSGGAFGVASGICDRDDFRMRLAGLAMPALSNHFAVADQDASNPGIGVCAEDSLARQLQRTRHEFTVFFRKISHD